VMDVLSEAKQKGVIRAHGVSCYTLPALRAAAASPWGDIDLVRPNPIGSHMDADPDTVISVIMQMRTQGKGIVGMKILGQGDLRGRPAEAIRYALGHWRSRCLYHRGRIAERTGQPRPAYRRSLSTACSKTYAPY
jgi:hypothetical protein